MYGRGGSRPRCLGQRWPRCLGEDRESATSTRPGERLHVDRAALWDQPDGAGVFGIHPPGSLRPATSHQAVSEPRQGGPPAAPCTFPVVCVLAARSSCPHNLEKASSRPLWVTLSPETCRTGSQVGLNRVRPREAGQPACPENHADHTRPVVKLGAGNQARGAKEVSRVTQTLCRGARSRPSTSSPGGD